MSYFVGQFIGAIAITYLMMRLIMIVFRDTAVPLTNKKGLVFAVN